MSLLVGREPASSYRAVERRTTWLLIAVLLGLAGLAWWVTVTRARSMDTMGEGMAGMDQSTWMLGGVASPIGVAEGGAFLVMWLVMMVAMMFPTIAPIVLLHRMVMRRAGAGPGTSVAFACGYLGVWTLSGIVPLAVLVAFRDASRETGAAVATGGVLLVAAGVYQFTAWKNACQHTCQTPMTFLLTHDFGHGRLGALRTGAVHGLYCLGCCWALMAVLFVVGLMNLTWMALISVVFLLEKHLARGQVLARVVGAAVTAYGVTVLLSPGVLTG